jgi:serine/threonine protein kinase
LALIDAVPPSPPIGTREGARLNQTTTNFCNRNSGAVQECCMNTPVLAEPCPECGSPVAAQGLCARCLLEGAAASTEPVALRTNPPSLDDVRAAFTQLEVLEMIGRGGMGAVFKVRQPKLNRWAALKLLPESVASDPAFAGRFEREAQLLARLSHPNITAVYDYGQAGGFYYVLMEFIDGVNLRQAMQASRFTPAQALGIVPKICEALQYAHEEGVLHRDIKPENILIDAKGRVKLADFGIAKIVTEVETHPASVAASGEGITHAGTTLGTPQYMAPEQRETPDDVDHRADIYSLGVVFYELLTGELPVGKFAPPSAISAADPRVDAIVQQALENERERRQHSAGEMRTQVETIRGTAALPTPAFPAEAGAGGPEVSRMVNAPAIGLMVVSALNILILSAGLIFILFFVPWETSPAGDAATYTGPNGSFTMKSGSALDLHPAWTASVPITFSFGILPSIVTFIGALRMRRLQGYGSAVVGAVLGMVTPPGLFVGFVFGIWALVVLAQRPVRAAFQSVPGTPLQRVRWPALGVMAVSAVNLLLLGRMLFLVHSGSDWESIEGKDLLNYAGPNLSFRFEMLPTGIHPALLTFAPIFLIVATLPALIFLGAWRMRQLRGYRLAVAAAILTILIPFGMFGNIFLGIWMLAVLARRDVQAEFDGGHAGRKRGGVFLALSLIAGVMLLLVAWLVAIHVRFNGGNWNLQLSTPNGEFSGGTAGSNTDSAAPAPDSDEAPATPAP